MINSTMEMINKIARHIIILLTVGLLSYPCFALESKEILVLANREVLGSIEIAKYYLNARKIPSGNLVILRTAVNETLFRDQYEKEIVLPVRSFLQDRPMKHEIKCIVLMYGIPLRIADNKDMPPGRSKKRNNQTDDTRSSVDSELSLVLELFYPLSGWITNPHYSENKSTSIYISKENVLMVSRLDGPSAAIVKRIIDDSLVVEKEGLKGNAYFDARWPNPPLEKHEGYARYDESIHNASGMIEKSKLMPVVLNQEKELFKAGECDNAALYCGWYSLANYVDSFQWARGAVGYHIASAECSTLKNKKSRVWCKMMLEKGGCATIGPVGEPYVQAFPLPELFFEFLQGGKLSLVDCYYKSVPHLSWKMVLIGDPLYRPFKNRN